MSKIDKKINEIEIEAFYRSSEITLMFSQISLFNEDNKSGNFLEKYFLARSIVVFSYGTLEKFVKTLTTHALTAIIDNEYFLNNTKDFLCILKSKNKPLDLFNLLMFYKNNDTTENKFEYAIDKGYFNGRDRIDSATIAHISDVLGLNCEEPLLKIPKVTIDSICRTRMTLAHGDYIGELKRILNPKRSNITISDIDEIINDLFKLTDNTKDDLIAFINDFKDKIVDLLKKIDEYGSIVNIC